MKTKFILGIGNVYVETNYLSLETGNLDSLHIGKEYRSKRYETRLGGSVVNFIVQAKNLNYRVGLVGKCGDDDAGKKLFLLLESEGISTSYITVSSQVQTSVDTGVILAHSGQNIQLVSGNANQSLTLAEIQKNEALFDSVDAVYLGGVLKAEALYKDYPELLEWLSKKTIRLFLDHGRIPVDISDEKRSILIKSLAYIEGYLPNEEEILGITQKNSLDEALEVALTFGPQFIVVKQGAGGCRIKTKNIDISLPGYDVSVVSTVGAGDAFNAGFITHYLNNVSLENCGKFANAVAAYRVSVNTHASEEDIEKFIALK